MFNKFVKIQYKYKISSTELPLFKSNMRPNILEL